MPCGNKRADCVMAACTSTAAPSRLRLRANSRVTCVFPSEFTDVIESRPAIIEKLFSSGVATLDAMVSGLAPGRLAVTISVGKSTLGRSLTGSERYATMPNRAIATSLLMVAIALFGMVAYRSHGFALAKAFQKRCVVGIYDGRQI